MRWTVVAFVLVAAACARKPVATPPLGNPVELLLVGGTILTMDPARPTVEAVGVADGRIVWIGSAKEAPAHAGPTTRSSRWTAAR